MASVDVGTTPARPLHTIPRRILRLRSDAALAERFAGGDEAAFGVLFERYRASVLAVCIGVLGSSHDAEDAAQDAFASLAVALRNAPPRELRAWLTRVARNAAIDLARKRRSRAFADCDLPEDGGLATDGVLASHGLKVELESVISGIRELPESQRTALLMRELAGHSYAEIAALLDTDEAAVRGLIARARIGLRAHRQATELPCAAAREAMAAEPDGRRHNRTVRRHVRGCAACRSYRYALRDDARALRGLLPVSGGAFAGGGAVAGGLVAKGALLGATVGQMTAACAVSVCAVGGIVLLAPPGRVHHPARSAGAAAARRTVGVARASAAGTASATTRSRAATPRSAPPSPTVRDGHPAPTATAAGSGATTTAGGTVVHSSPSVVLGGRFSTPHKSSTTRGSSATPGTKQLGSAPAARSGDRQSPLAPPGNGAQGQNEESMNPGQTSGGSGGSGGMHQQQGAPGGTFSGSPSAGGPWEPSSANGVPTPEPTASAPAPSGTGTSTPAAGS